MILRRVLALVAALSAALAARTLLPDSKQVRTVGPFIHDTWRIEDGLPQNSVSAMAQTRDGYLWLATFDGLVRFDGSRFTTFNPGNTKEMKTSRLEKLFVDRSGALWIFPDRTGSEAGPIVYANGVFKSFASAPGFPSRHVLSVHEDRAGGVWFKTEGNQLIRFQAGQFRTFGAEYGIPAAATIGEVEPDGRGNVWIGTDRGLLRFSAGRFQWYTAKDGLPSAAIGPIRADAGGNVWIGTNRGLARFADGRFTPYGIREGLPGNLIDYIYTDGSGAVWAATDKALMRLSFGKFLAQPSAAGAVAEMLADGRGGLWIRPGKRRWKGDQFLDAGLWPDSASIYLLRDGKITCYDARAGLSEHFIYSLYVDREGSLWIGRAGAGLERLRPSSFSTYAREDGLRSETVRCVEEASDGSLWIGTQGGGLARLKNEKITVYTKANGLPADLVWSLAEDRRHNIWVGTEAGLTRFTNGKFVADAIGKAMAGKAVKCILETRNGDLWMGTDGDGSYRWRNGSLAHFTTKDGLSGNYIRVIHEDSRGALWLATDDGITELKDGQFRAITTRDGLSNRFVRAIYEDRAGTLWFGTYGGGLNRLRNGRFTVYTTDDGLFDQTVSQILEDGDGNFWMTCNRGIYRARRKDLDDFAEGRIKSFVSVSYGNDDGMKNVECNGGSQPAGWKGRDGQLWIPTMGGVVKIDVNRIRPNPTPPPVIIEQVRINQTPVDVRGYASLHAGNGDVRIRYTALSFLSPRKVNFKYRLEGFDKGWVAAGNQRTVRYTDIPPGRYTFQVVACNNDGVWNERGASFAFALQPLYYQTVWFYVLCGALVGASAFGIYRVRVSGLRAREKKLERRVDERTAELKRQIDEREKAETALRHAEEKYRGIFEQTILGIFQTSAEGAILECNPAMARMCGYDSPAAMTAGLTDVGQQGYVDAGRREEFKRIMEEEGIVEGFEFEARRRDGGPVWFSENARAVRDPNGRIVSYVGISEDITRRKRVEAELLQAKDAAEAASRAKSEFLANMSHEIRTPMNGIMGMTRVAPGHGPQRRPARLPRHGEELRGSLLTIINDILDFSKIEAGKLDLDDTEFQVRDEFEETIKSFGLRACHKGLELACAVDPAVPEVVRGDPGRLRQVINNLVGNAVKFTERGEVVAQVEVAAREAGRVLLHFTITDTGIGVPPEKQRKIFEAFSQADNSTTRKYGGTGLGLTVSSCLVSLMGGEIWLESEVGRGSRFHFTISLLAPDERERAGPVPLARLHGVRTLVVDDNATNRRILEDMLKNWSMPVTCVDGGRAALESLRAAAGSGAPFQLMITDGHMPEMDGRALIEEVRRTPGLVAEIVMLTSAGRSRRCGSVPRARDRGIPDQAG